MSEPPDWLIEYGERVVEALGLSEWDIRYSWHRTIGGEADKLGRCCAQYEYEDAHLLFRDTLIPDREGYETVTHEHLHPALANCELAMQLILMMVPQAQRPVAQAAWGRALEQDLTRLGRALTRKLRPALPQDTEEQKDADDRTGA